MSTSTEPSPRGEIQASFEGEPLTCAPGASVAAALIATGKSAWRDTRGGASRGLFCGIGVCFDCLVEIDGESGQRACMIPLADGMDVRRATGPGAGDHSEEASAASADRGEGGEA